jgi:hypothetical protein
MTAPKRRRPFYNAGVSKSESDQAPYWQRRPYRSQVIILMLIGVGPFLIGAAIAIVLPLIQALRQMVAT